MANIKVKNVGNSLVVVPDGRGGDVIILPGHEAQIEEKYLPHFSGKLVKVEVLGESTEAVSREEVIEEKQRQRGRRK